MNLTDEQFDKAVEMSNDIIDFVWDDKTDELPALACLMAAVPYLLDSQCTTGEACRLLKILMNSYGAKDGAEKH